MSSATAPALPAAFSPGLVPADPLAAYWLSQVTLRLRREVWWIWHERGLAPAAEPSTLPPLADRALEALDLARYAEAKRRFFFGDETARYLSERLADPEPPRPERPLRGSFSWLAEELELTAVERFALALALLPAFDSAAGSVLAACSNDAGASRPTLALAQRLWDDGVAVLGVAQPGHRLFRRGLVQRAEPAGAPEAAVGWHEPLAVPALVVQPLLFPGGGRPASLRALERPRREAGGEAAPQAPARLASPATPGLRVVPVLGPRGSEHAQAAAGAGAAAGRGIEAYDGPPGALAGAGALGALAASGWLRGTDLFFDLDAASALLALRPVPLPDPEVPLRLYLAAEGAGELAGVPDSLRLPPVRVPRLSYAGRVDLWRRELGPRKKGRSPEIAEISRRFRLEAAPIRAICRDLDLDRDGDGDARALAAACRAELTLDLGDLAEEIRPRFRPEELVLPHKQALQLDEIRRAMRSLSEVHYGWGTARVWDEAGLAVLFAGAPGTGKTMAAEVLAAELDLPLYRIDLSQVVNKYVGETEKNLKRVFDACEASDLILLFDEADSLFGRRTKVRDAHDRYANLETSYLLSRMERSKGLTILATNRKEDLDEAFLRRLRYVVDFPVPEAAERRRIWQVAIPEGVDAGDVDVRFLAEGFPLTGGHIRSAVFNACLQSAGRGQAGARGRGRRKLRMEDVLVAVRRELDKAGRAVTPDRFGPWAELVRGLDHPAGGAP
jgi:adenylate kinase family enzyme